MSKEEKLVISQDTIDQNYSEHLALYTDGSILEETADAAQSAAAALWIPDFQHPESWKMDHCEARSIMAVELAAIDKALTWVLIHSVILHNKKIAILTDSRAGIAALKKYSPKHHSNIINQIKEKIEQLNTEDFDLTIQWIPSHVGVPGNEMADQLAREAHTKGVTNFPLEISEIIRKVRKRLIIKWQQQYDTQKDTLHLGQIKGTIASWPWASVKSRKHETTLAKLRLGHIALNQYLARFRMRDDPNCPTCLVPEDVHHFILNCSLFTNQRAVLKRELASLNVINADLCTILGGAPYSEEKQRKIIEVTCKFLTSTGKLDQL